MVRIALAGLVLAVLSVFTAAPTANTATASPVTTHVRQESRQNQGDPNATYWPEVEWPIGNRHGTGQTTYLALDARHDTWGRALRRFGAYVNTQHIGVRVLVHHRCSEAPSDPCVRLRENAPASCRCYAQEVNQDTPMERLIQVRPDAPRDIAYAIVAHEFGHALGMEHHDRRGVDGAWSNEVHFSSPERLALRAMYVWKH